MPASLAVNQVFEAVKARLESSGQFGSVEMKGGMLVAAAKASAEPAFYRLEFAATGSPDGGGEGRLWVSLVTPSRWLSESIESDLVEHGDDLGDLVEDELVELGYEPTGGGESDSDGGKPTFQHFRSPDLLYTFRTPIPTPQPGSGVSVESERALAAHAAATVAGLWVLAYEQAFRRLGDMEDKGDE